MDTSRLCVAPLDYPQLDQFITVAEHRSITKAAHELFISQQALSKSIQHMEDGLGVKLFVRTGQGTELTEIGKKLLPVAQTAISQLDFYTSTMRRIIETEKGSITIAFENAYMPYVIPAELTARVSGITIKSVNADGRERCIETVAHKEADIGFCSYTDERGSLSYQSVITEPIMFLMSADNRLAKKEALTMDDMRKVDHVLPLGNIAIMHEYIDACLKEGFYPNFVFEASDFDLLVRNVQVNNAVQLTASFALTEHSSDDLVLRPLVCDTLKAEYGFVYRADDLTLPVRSFMNAVLSYYDRERTF